MLSLEVPARQPCPLHGILALPDPSLCADLANDLSAWLEEQLAVLRTQARTLRKPIPDRLPATTPVLRIPSGLSRIFDRDLAAADIPKRDQRNRVVDVHALRVTFGTHLCAAGVPLRTAQAALRHSKPELTANIYTDPKLLDVAGAIDALPELALMSEAALHGESAASVRPRALPLAIS